MGEINVDVKKEDVGAPVDCGPKLEQSHLDDDEQSQAVTPREGYSGQKIPTQRDSQRRPFRHESGVKVKDMVSVGDDASVKRTREQSVNEVHFSYRILFMVHSTYTCVLFVFMVHSFVKIFLSEIQ